MAVSMAVCFSVWQPAGDGVTEYGRQFPVIVERALDEAGERGENGWELVRAITRAMNGVRYPPEGQVPADFDAISRLGSERQEGREAAIKALAELENAGFFATMDELSRARRVVWPADKGAVIGQPLEEWGALRTAMRVTAARMATASERGDGPEVARGLEHTLALGRVSTYYPLQIGRLTGTACIHRGVIELQGALPALTATDLRACEAAMDRQLRLAPYWLMFEGERLSDLDSVMVAYGDGERLRVGEPPMFISPELRERLDAGDVEKAVDKAGALAFAERRAARRIAMSKLPLAAMLAEAAAIDAEEIPKEQFVAWMLRSEARDAVQRLFQGEAVISGLRAMVAVELWQREHGAYPATLAELKGEFADPYTGGALRYVRLDAKDDVGRGYVLYSVGLDGEDNGGKEHEKAAYVAATPKGKGFDFVINARKP